MEKELKISSFSVGGKKATLYQLLESMAEKNLYQANTNIELNTNGQTTGTKVLGEKLPEGKPSEVKSSEDKLSEGKSPSPLLILHCFSEEEEAVVKLLKGKEYFSFPLLCINNLDWQKDMCPWDSPALIKNEKDFIGGADVYLSLLEKEIIPKAVEILGEEPSYYALAGYSLAGLFALYAGYRSSLFSRIASVSGSLWYPDFVSFAKEKKMLSKAERLYLSLGTEEAKTKHAVLSTIERKTRELVEHYQSSGYCVNFELNPGNHFCEVEKRIEKGIRWIMA
ncbi:alpha/beta hydrolase [Oribacterium sinus]